MTSKTKSGKEILDEFFSQIKEIKNVDENIASILLKLYQEGKLTNATLSNELRSLREQTK